MSVRVRYAPSPTGSPHVGNIRDALFKHLFARRHGGVNILRIEDTDRSRYIPEAEQDIMESLQWLGIEWQEGPDIGGPHGPYRQSERKEACIYSHWIEQLVAAGHAYKAFETPAELEEMREFQRINKQQEGYFGGTWRDASPDAAHAAEQTGKPYVIRQRIPRNQTIAIEDAIRGRIEWDSNTVDDPVLIKADGMPTYHFAAMVDDHLMGITHIIRGEEWISSAPKHAALFDAFGWERPIFVHCPVIKGKDGKKLSKRHGDTRVLDYRSAGYLPAALNNFIALIGWAPGGDRELMTMKELEETFDLDGLQPSPGVFDLDKLRWMNGHYIRAMEIGPLLEAVEGYVAHPETLAYWESRDLEPGQPDPATFRSSLPLLAEAAGRDPALFAAAVKLEQERVQTLADFGPACEFFFVDRPEMDPKAVEKWLTQEHVPSLLDQLTQELGGKQAVTVDECEALIRVCAAERGFEKLGPVVHPTRVALTGKTAGPGLFELMAVLGPSRMIERLRRAATVATR